MAHFPSALQPSLDAKVTDAFMQGLHRGCLVAALAAILVAVAALTYLPKASDPANEKELLHA